MTMNRSWMQWIGIGYLALAGLAAQGQDLRFTALQDVKCQELNPDDLTRSNPKVINFDASTQAYVVCLAQNALPSLQVVAAGLVPQIGSESELGLDAFQSLKSEQNSKDLFVRSNAGDHRVADFSIELLSLSAAPADQLLGPAKTKTVNQQVCKTEYQTKQVCSTQPKEVCKTVYGRTECYTEYVEVCKDVTKPVEVCVNKPTLEYFHELPKLSGYWKQKPTGYCPKGEIEKRTRVVYGRTIEEQRCCEVKVVYGQTQKTCSAWVEL